MVEGVQRPGARCLDLHGVSPESHAARGGLPDSASPGTVVDRPGRVLSAESKPDGQLHTFWSQQANGSGSGRRRVRTTVLRPVGLWFQSRLGARLLGPVPP